MKVLVTGADGFVGPWMIRRLLDDGREVVGAAGPDPGRPLRADPLTDEERRAVRWRPLDVLDGDSVARCLNEAYDAVIHLAGVASGAAAARDPGDAWSVNAAGTARIAHALAEARRAGRADAALLYVSTAEVYGAGSHAPRKEADAPAPRSAYAASKLGGEEAALESWRRVGLRVIVVRPFAHTGAGQDTRFVVPAFAQRLRVAKKLGAPVVKVGNLEPVREFLHVRDVVDAYARLIVTGEPGETYNVASGAGISLEQLFFTMAELLGVRPIPEADPDLLRAADIPHLVGDATKLRTATGWAPRVSLDQTLKDVLDATAD